MTFIFPIKTCQLIWWREWTASFYQSIFNYCSIFSITSGEVGISFSLDVIKIQRWNGTKNSSRISTNNVYIYTPHYMGGLYKMLLFRSWMLFRQIYSSYSNEWLCVTSSHALFHSFFACYLIFFTLSLSFSAFPSERWKDIVELCATVIVLSIYYYISRRNIHIVANFVIKNSWSPPIWIHSWTFRWRLKPHPFI